MQDHDLETSVRDTPTYLLHFLLENLNTIVRLVANHNFKNKFFILAVLFLLLIGPVFHNIYLHERVKN